MGKGKKAAQAPNKTEAGKPAKAAAAATAVPVPEPEVEEASEGGLGGESADEVVIEADASPEASGDSDDDSEVSGDSDAKDDEEDELTEETLKKMFDLLGPDAVKELQLADAEGEEDDVDDDEAEEEGSQEENSEANEAEQQEDGSDDSEAESEPEPPKTRTDPVALERVLNTFKLDTNFFDTQTLTYPEPLDIPDAGDDLSREVQFYKQSLWAANEGRQRFIQANKPFQRPNDFYAEMVKSDSHMERIRQKLLDERAGIEASEKARAQRQLKKYGKQVQVAKLQERQQAKKDLDTKVKDFKNKKKRSSNNLEDDNDQFGVELDEGERPVKKPRGLVVKQRGGKAANSSGASKMPREARNAKYGKPSAGRRSKQNTKESSGDLGGFNKGRSKQKSSTSQKASRPGKSKRDAKRS